MIKIPILRLDNIGSEFSGTEPPEFISEDNKDIVCDEIHYDIHASMVSTEALIRGSISTIVEDKCVRCLEQFKNEIINSEVCHLYDNPGEGLLDISVDLKEDLLMKIPIHPICDEDCKGLCSSCGDDLNKKECHCEQVTEEESPWNALDNLK